MKKIYNIKYFDASYSYAKKINQSNLALYDTYGYIKRNGNNIIVSFIQKQLSGGKKEVSLGLVIPDVAIVSTKNSVKIKNDLFVNFKIGMSVAIEWRDIVIFDSGDLRNDCPIMYTEGILFKIEKDYIILKNPETIRIYPTPIKNHPIKKPNYYIIPKSFINIIKTIQ